MPVRFLEELRRRNVIRMAGLYLVGAWLITQVAGTVLPMFGAPDWLPRSIVIVLALGFLPALAFAWVFELTPDGLKRDVEVPIEHSIAPQTGQRMNRLIVALLGLAIIYFCVDKYVLAPRRDAALVASTTQAAKAVAAEQAVAKSGDKSIAVMPFVNMSADPEQEYFSDGMTEELLNALAKVPMLEVTARTSVFSLKGQNKDVREIGELLGVAYLLEGSVRKSGDQVRITAQLIRTDNGFHLWSETYDRKLENVFSLQTELAGAIAQALQLPLGMGGSEALVSERTTDPQAYGMYLQARAAYRARGQGVKRSIELYRAALERDPKFAPAWAGLSASLSVLPWYIPEAERANTPAFMREAEQAGKQALALSPELAAAHTALAAVYNFQWQWALAGQHLDQALALAPNDPEVHYVRADWLAVQGRLAEALQASERTVAMDPLVPIYLNGQANALQRLGRQEDALAVRQAAFALAPDVQLLSNNLFGSYLRLGRLDEAEKLLDDTRARDAARPKTVGPPRDPQWQRRSVLRLARDPGQAEALRKELGEQDFERVRNGVSQEPELGLKVIEGQLDKHQSGVDPIISLRTPVFDAYRKDPRYLRLLRKVGLDEDGRIP